jgi:hypothetical protein
MSVVAGKLVSGKTSTNLRIKRRSRATRPTRRAWISNGWSSLAPGTPECTSRGGLSCITEPDVLLTAPESPPKRIDPCPAASPPPPDRDQTPPCEQVTRRRAYDRSRMRGVAGRPDQAHGVVLTPSILAMRRRSRQPRRNHTVDSPGTSRPSSGLLKSSTSPSGSATGVVPKFITVSHPFGRRK